MHRTDVRGSLGGSGAGGEGDDGVLFVGPSVQERALAAEQHIVRLNRVVDSVRDVLGSPFVNRIINGERIIVRSADPENWFRPVVLPIDEYRSQHLPTGDAGSEEDVMGGSSAEGYEDSDPPTAVAILPSVPPPRPPRAQPPSDQAPERAPPGLAPELALGRASAGPLFPDDWVDPSSSTSSTDSE